MLGKLNGSIGNGQKTVRSLDDVWKGDRQPIMKI